MMKKREVENATAAPTAEFIEKVSTGNIFLEDDPHRAAVEENPEVAVPLNWSTILAVFFLGVAFSGAIGTGFLLSSSILEPIGLALGNIEQVPWVATGWALTSGLAMAIAGRLSDIFGRRPVILTGQVIVIIGSIVAATAKHLSSVIAGSAIIGLGLGCVFASYAGIAEILPNKWRGIGLAWTEIGIGIPWGVLATLLGNELAEHASWRWTYYITIIYSVISFIGTAAFYFPPPRPQHDVEKSRWQEFLELDFVGFFLYAGGTTSLLIGLGWAGQTAHPWQSASVIAPIVIGSIALVAAFVYDWVVQPPLALLPLHLFRMIREFTLSLIVVFVGGMVFLTMASFLPRATSIIYDSDPLKLGIDLIPNGVGLIFGGVVFGSLIHKIKYVQYQIVVAIGLQTLFTGLYAYAVTPGHKAAWIAFQFFGTVGYAWITLAATVLVSVNVPLRDLGIASGLVGSFRSIGGSIGIAVFNTILGDVFAGQVGKRVVKAAVASGLKPTPKMVEGLIGAATLYIEGNTFAFAAIPGATPALVASIVGAYREAYAYACQRMLYATIPFGVIATIIAFWIKDPSPYLTNHTAVRLRSRGTEDRSGATRVGAGHSTV